VEYAFADFHAAISIHYFGWFGVGYVPYERQYDAWYVTGSN
jgi:hypothetical protein